VQGVHTAGQLLERNWINFAYPLANSDEWRNNIVLPKTFRRVKAGYLLVPRRSEKLQMYFSEDTTVDKTKTTVFVRGQCNQLENV
jgi:hypothetical protein